MSAQLARQIRPGPRWSPSRPVLLQRKCGCGTHTPAGEGCAACAADRESAPLQHGSIQREPDNQVPPVVHSVLRESGRPLEAETRDFMESRFGYDFSAVRVHADSRAAESAQAVRARAYTVGGDIVFGAGQYSTATEGGQRLLAHELAHVVQQGGSAAGIQPSAITASDHPTEREADAAAEAVLSGRHPRVALKSPGTMLHRSEGDLVAYSGGQSGTVTVVKAKKVIHVSSSVSGHPGRGVDEPGAGPIPDGMYKIHPAVTQPTVSKLQSGVCGADPISIGYQEITSTDATPCSAAHYCNVPCPTKTEPARMCFTPVDCWGPKRIKIEGSAKVKSGGKIIKRDGFYIHGGNPKDAVSSGCVKALGNDVFVEIRKLKGEVPFCVGAGCPPSLAAAVGAAAVETLTDAAGEAVRSLGTPFGL